MSCARTPIQEPDLSSVEKACRFLKSNDPNMKFLNTNYLRPGRDLFKKDNILRIELDTSDIDNDKLKTFNTFFNTLKQKITDETGFKVEEKYVDYSKYFNWNNEFITPEKKQKFLEKVLYKIYDVPEDMHVDYEECFDDYTMHEMLDREKKRDYYRIYKKMYPDTKLTLYGDFYNYDLPEMFQK